MPAMAATYLGLLTAAPTDSAGGTEVPDADGYNRVNVTGKFADPVNGAISNNAVLQWPDPTDDWGDVGWVGLYDDPDPGEGNLLRYVKLTSPKTVGAGDPPSFATGALTFRED